MQEGQLVRVTDTLSPQYARVGKVVEVKASKPNLGPKLVVELTPTNERFSFFNCELSKYP